MLHVVKRTNGQLAPKGSVLDQLFQDNVSRFFNDDFWGFPGVKGSAAVPVNIRETDKQFELELVAPGLRKEDFNLNVSGDTLTISFETKQDKSEDASHDTWIRREYQQASFSRTFQLGDQVDVNAIAARYENGMLQLVLPKNEHSRAVSRNITIQ